MATSPAIQLSPHQAQLIGQRIWQNEGAGRVENLAVWNKGEAFPSFGIGHFIWFPKGVEEPFHEGFPQLLRYLKQTTTLPDWLEQATDAPWNSREDFLAARHSIEMKDLRKLLQESIPQQVDFIVRRMEASLPKMLAILPTLEQKKQIEKRFYRVAQQPNGIYALIDYVNFKGEGTSEKERYHDQGWGLLQVLGNMNDDTAVMQDFVRAADYVLTRRTENAARDESGWLPGWRKRLQTYLVNSQ
jgi:hypothetical protein